MPYERAAGGYMAARKASKKVINFFVVGLTYGCRSRCGCKRGISVFLFSFLNSCFIVTCVMGFRLLCKNTLSDVAQAGRRRK